MGDVAGLHDPEARVPRDRRLTKRRILKDVGPLRFGEGHDTTFPYALALATGAEYDWLMGSSGAAFTTTIDETGWDPLAAAPRDAETLARAARAAGVRLDPEPPPYDEEMRALILDRAKEAIDGHLPPLVFGLGGPLRDDERWSDAKHAGTAAFADHAMRTILVDKRRAAARFLRAARGLFPNAPGGDLLRAAESYGYAADAAAKGGVGEFNGSIAMRFIDQGHRRAWAKNLDAVRENDREAREALASARGGMR